MMNHRHPTLVWPFILVPLVTVQPAPFQVVRGTVGTTTGVQLNNNAGTRAAPKVTCTSAAIGTIPP